MNFFKTIRFYTLIAFGKLTTSISSNFRLDQPVFLVGVNRSGTRLVENILRPAEEVLPWSEANHLWEPHYYQFLDITSPRCEIPGFVGRGIHAHEIPRSVQEQTKRRVKQLFWLFCQWTGKRILHRNPINSIRPQHLTNWFDNPRIIHVVRDARAAINSFVQKNKDGEYDVDELVTMGTYRWKECVRRLTKLRSKQPKTVAQVKYADLSEEHSTSIIRELYKFCNLDLSECPWKKGPEVENRNHKWKEHFSGDQVDRIQREIQNDWYLETEIPSL